MILRVAAAVLLCMAAGCRAEEPYTAPGPEGKDKVCVRFGAAVPGTAATRALYDNEYELAEAGVLVFHEGAFYEYVDADAAPVATGSGYTFTADLTYTDDPVTIMVVGNCNAILSGHPALVKGAPADDVVRGLTASFGPYASGSFQLFPLSGQAALSSLTEDTRIENLKLLRAFARIEVHFANNIPQSSKLETMQAFRAPDSFCMLSGKLNNGGTKVTAPQVPSGVAFTEDTYTSAVTDARTITGIYLPESEGGDIDDVACVVVGISNNGGARTYYRLDLVKDGTIGKILRNHNYTITVTSISGDGHVTASAAAANASANINTELIEWEDDGTNTIYDKDGKYISLSSRNIPLHFYRGSTRTVTVEKTIANDYTVEFAGEDGKPQGSQVCGYGGEISNGKFLVKVAADGSGITATALQDNDSDSDVTQKLLVGIGNIEFPVTITQASRLTRDHVHIFNLLGLDGDLGDEVMNAVSTQPMGNRRGLLDMLKNPDNFDYYGTVPFAGFKISGLNYQIAVSKYLIDIFDVVFVGFSNGAAIDDNEARVLGSWLEKPNKVLVVYANNTEIMSRLGVTATAGTNYHEGKGYYVDPVNTPAFILEGPFGTVSPSYVAPTVPIHSTVHTIDPALPAHAGIRPVLMNPVDDRILIGVDPDRRIVYYNDYWLYDSGNTLLTGGGIVNNEMDTIIANLWAWIAETVLGDEHDTGI